MFTYRSATALLEKYVHFQGILCVHCLSQTHQANINIQTQAAVTRRAAVVSADPSFDLRSSSSVPPVKVHSTFISVPAKDNCFPKKKKSAKTHYFDSSYS